MFSATAKSARRTLGKRLAFAGITATAIACAGSGDSDTRTHPDSLKTTTSIHVTDDAGFAITLDHPAQRVISLVPSATEMLVAIGGLKQVVGRTRYDNAPEVAGLPSVGGGLDPSVEAIVALHPDLVISWESDKKQEVRAKLMKVGIPVFILRSQDTTDIFNGIANIGRLSGHDSAARAVASSMRATLDSVRDAVKGLSSPSVFYVVYDNPPMTTGPNTFVGQLITLAGARSIFANETKLWPNVSLEEVVRRNPDMLVVPVGDSTKNALGRFGKMQGWRDLRAVRTHKVFAVPADLMSRPSPSIAAASRVLLQVFHPEAVPRDSSRRATAGAAK